MAASPSPRLLDLDDGDGNIESQTMLDVLNLDAVETPLPCCSQCPGCARRFRAK